MTQAIFSSPDSAHAASCELPALGEHDLRVEVAAVSVNPADVKVAQGLESPRILGFDAAGTVTEVGSAVTLFAPGDEVFYAGSIDRPGSNQRLHTVDERIVGPKPRILDFAAAASLPLTSITAWECLFDRLLLDAQSTGTLLVIGATGGVGSMLIQLAAALLPGVTVIATASDEKRAQWVRELGAAHTVNHHGDLSAQVKALAPEGVDWVFSAHSEGQLDLYAQLTRPFGHIVAIDDGPRDVEPLKERSITWHWEFMFTRPLFRTPDMVAQHELLTHVATLVEAGSLHPTNTLTLNPISAANLDKAYAQVAAGHMLGKLVLAGWAD
ncbi:zinc-binding alcohol dehydrogenase family protein [Corynebacterium flavescens]|uniref:zinc-binding alcohol dehydrogenase family protein n=1 Tax=Corynebacterium flavescens TaxID=28028 RepID=UPI003FD1D7C9